LQGVVGEDVFPSPLTDCPLIVIAKGGEQQEGGLDGAGDGEVGEVGEFSYSEFVQCAKEITPIVGISCVGHEKQFLALLTNLEEEHHHEVSATPSKHGTKGSRELKNLECSINFDARGDCSSRFFQCSDEV
jgi:hypothetical protein